jgi:ATP:ADP antiporter, AAA family
MKNPKGFYILTWMVLLSLALGVYISYFFVFVNALFISEIGTSELPLAYIFSGLGGTMITWLFNIAEKKWGFAKSSTLFCLFFAFVMFSLWFFYIQGIHLYFLIFFSYAWFWVSINFTTLIFWKLPSYIFNLSENKNYNGVISTGEVISAIIAYLSVPALLNLDFFTRDKLLLVSFFGIALFSFITFILGQTIKNKAPLKQKESNKILNSDQTNLLTEPYFQLIFISVFLGVIIQLLVDFSLMEVSAQQMSDPNELAKYFALLFGAMRVLELILKSFVSKYLVREFGVFISLSTLIFALAFIAIIGLSSLFFGYFGLILIVASLSKVFERSLYRSIYAPTINVLYQAYPITKRALTQNYADGFGKTIGQLMAAVILFIIATIDSFESKVFILLLSILVILFIWLIVSKKLTFHYKIELLNILKSLGEKNKLTIINKDSSIVTENLNIAKKNCPNVHLKKALSVEEQIIFINFLFDIESHESALKNEISELNTTFNSNQALTSNIKLLIEVIKEYNKNELFQVLNHITSLKEKLTRESKLLHLLNLYIQISLIKITTNFKFFNFNKKLRSVDFLSSALIQNLADLKFQDLSKQDYYFLLEERIQKYTYLLACSRDIGKSNSILSNMVLLEIKATKNDILYSLNFHNDPIILNQIINMLNIGDKTQELIALELLELILEEQEKKWILPIFRENQTENILNKLESEFPQILMGKEKRLISILANNLIDIPAIIKSTALIELISSFPDPTYYQLVNTISKNSSGVIQFVANRLMQIKNNSNNKALATTTNIFSDLLNTSTDQFQKSEISTTLQYLYWIEDSESDNQNENKMTPVYNNLYKSVFPMERLELVS